MSRIGLDQRPLAGLVEIEFRDLGQGGDIGRKEPAVLPLNEPPPRKALQRLNVQGFGLTLLGLLARRHDHVEPMLQWRGPGLYCCFPFRLTPPKLSRWYTASRLGLPMTIPTAGTA